MIIGRVVGIKFSNALIIKINDKFIKKKKNIIKFVFIIDIITNRYLHIYSYYMSFPTKIWMI